MVPNNLVFLSLLFAQVRGVCVLRLHFVFVLRLIGSGLRIWSVVSSQTITPAAYLFQKFRRVVACSIVLLRPTEGIEVIADNSGYRGASHKLVKSERTNKPRSAPALVSLVVVIGADSNGVGKNSLHEEPKLVREYPGVPAA